MITITALEDDLTRRGLWLSWVSQVKLQRNKTVHSWTVYIQRKSKVITKASAVTLNEAKRAAYAKLPEETT